MTKPTANVPISKRLVGINSASSVITRLLTLGVFGWAIKHLMARVPEDELALLPVIMSITMMLPLAQSILTAGLARFVTEAYSKDDSDRIVAIVSTIFPLLVLVSLGQLFVGAMIVYHIDQLVEIADQLIGQARVMLTLVFVQVAFEMSLAVFNTGLFARQKFVWLNGIQVAGSCLRIVLMFSLIVGISPQVQWVIVSQVSYRIWVLLASTYFSVRLMPALRYRRGYFRGTVAREVLSFGGWFSLGQLASAIRQASDAPILYVLSTPLQVNIFFLGSFIESQLRHVITGASQPLLPALTAMHAMGQRQRLANAYLRGGRIALWASMAVATPLMVFCRELFQIYLGQDYRTHAEAATVMLLLLLGFPLTYPTVMLFKIAHAMGQVRSVMLRAIFAQVGNLVMTLVFVGWFQWGAIGSATATLITFAVVHPFFHWKLAMRMLQIRLTRLWRETLIPGLLPSAAGAAGGVAFALVFSPESIWEIAAGVAACLSVYVATLFMSLMPADRADLQRVYSFSR